MTDYIRIPKDAREGDIVWFRDGKRNSITSIHIERSTYDVVVYGISHGWIVEDGTSGVDESKLDVIGFQYADNRKPPLGAAKPKPHHHLVAFPTRAKARAAAKAFGGKVQS